MSGTSANFWTENAKKSNSDDLSYYCTLCVLHKTVGRQTDFALFRWKTIFTAASLPLVGWQEGWLAIGFSDVRFVVSLLVLDCLSLIYWLCVVSVFCNQVLAVYGCILVHIFSRLLIAILWCQISGYRPFSPILNIGIGRVPIPGFRDCKKLLKQYFLSVRW